MTKIIDSKIPEGPVAEKPHPRKAAERDRHPRGPAQTISPTL